ncbi:FkbM family methyltransferase, partial [bacterium]
MSKTPPLKPFKRLAKMALGRMPWIRVEARVPKLFLGSDYGGWAFCPDLIDKGSVIYDFGIGHDASFPVALIERYGCVVHGFDPSGVEEYVASLGLGDRFRFHPVGLADFDGEVEIRSQSATEGTSGTILGRDQLDVDTKGEKIEVKRLETLMKELGHSRIDLLKMDIEGAEFDVVEDFAKGSIRPTQVLIETHRY